MSFATINQCANDSAFLGRVTACVAGEIDQDPSAPAFEMRWQLATAADIAAAYESAVIGENPDPGGDPTVITDQMILSAVQAQLAAAAP